jgi:hypothetical protein
MPIMFNSVLREAGLPLKDVILLRHQDQRAERGRTPYELWRDDTRSVRPVPVPPGRRGAPEVQQSTVLGVLRRHPPPGTRSSSGSTTPATADSSTTTHQCRTGTPSTKPAIATCMGIPMMSISHSDLMPISAERSDAGLSQCETMIGIRQEFC